MAAYYPNNVTTDHIQQYLDENKSLILKIVESQNSGKLGECAENQARLQRNLMYLAAIADSQPQPPPSINSVQYSSGGMYQGAGSSAQYMQHQQQQMTPQSLMAARSTMLYGQQSYPALQHQHSQLGMSSSGGLHILQGEAHHSPGGSGGGGSSLGIGFNDYGRGGSKHDLGSFLSVEGRGGGGGGGNSSSGGGGGDGGETLYLKSANRD